eukprot:NODE_288_length_11703_cov_0.386591.p5 type:complete len:192 gc:universal NODE_288_length_11703_cov_0.386591:10195-9620(-)
MEEADKNNLRTNRKYDSLSYHSIEDNVSYGMVPLPNPENKELNDMAMKCLCFECDKCLAAIELQKYQIELQDDLEFITSYDINEEFSNLYNYDKHQNELIHPDSIFDFRITKKEVSASKKKMFWKMKWVAVSLNFLFLFITLATMIMSERNRIKNFEKQSSMPINSMHISLISSTFFVLSIALRIWIAQYL